MDQQRDLDPLPAGRSLVLAGYSTVAQFAGAVLLSRRDITT
jgi:hypothetical protein